MSGVSAGVVGGSVAATIGAAAGIRVTMGVRIAVGIHFAVGIRIAEGMRIAVGTGCLIAVAAWRSAGFLSLATTSRLGVTGFLMARISGTFEVFTSVAAGTVAIEGAAVVRVAYSVCTGTWCWRAEGWSDRAG